MHIVGAFGSFTGTVKVLSFGTSRAKISSVPLSADVFHWACLNEAALQLPANTAPAGHRCPCCPAPLFPPANLVSPVADALRQQLQQVNWARAGLGLPLVSAGSGRRGRPV